MLNTSITQASEEDEDIEDQISSRTVKHSVANVIRKSQNLHEQRVSNIEKLEKTRLSFMKAEAAKRKHDNKGVKRGGRGGRKPFDRKPYPE